MRRSSNFSTNLPPPAFTRGPTQIMNMVADGPIFTQRWVSGQLHQHHQVEPLVAAAVTGNHNEKQHVTENCNINIM